MDKKNDASEHSSEALARASASLADQQVDDHDNAASEDISATLHGSKAVTGKAVWSANNALRNADQSSIEKHDQERRDATSEEIRELMHLAEWNAQKTFVGGVEMTNAEAQEARQHIIDNDESFAERAVREGRISADQKEEYKWAIRRIKELEDKKGRGTISADEEQERERIKQSRAGQAAQVDTGRVRMESKNLDATLKADAETANSARRNTISAVPDDKMFQSAPELSNHFEDAKAATIPLDKKPIAVVTPPSPRVATMGIDV